MSAMTDDEQLESLKSFTKKYGSSIIIGILVALIAFSDGNIGRRKTWQNRKCRLPRFSN